MVFRMHCKVNIKECLSCDLILVSNKLQVYICVKKLNEQKPKTIVDLYWDLSYQLPCFSDLWIWTELHQ